MSRHNRRTCLGFVISPENQIHACSKCSLVEEAEQDDAQREIRTVARALLRLTRFKSERQGWDIFNEREIQRDDATGILPDDDVAADRARAYFDALAEHLRAFRAPRAPRRSHP